MHKNYFYVNRVQILVHGIWDSFDWVQVFSFRSDSLVELPNRPETKLFTTDRTKQKFINKYQKYEYE